MSRLRRMLALSAVVAGLALAPAAAHAACADAGTLPNAGNMPAAKAATLCLINERRAQARLAPLAGDPTLEAAATQYSLRMVAQSFFAHVAPDGSDPVDRLIAAGLRRAGDLFAGENLGYGSGGLESPALMVQAWMNSPSHRANVMSDVYRKIGIGIVPGTPVGSKTAGATYTTEFADTTNPAAKKPKKKAKKKKAKKKKHKKKRKKSAKR